MDTDMEPTFSTQIQDMTTEFRLMNHFYSVIIPLSWDNVRVSCSEAPRWLYICVCPESLYLCLQVLGRGTMVRRRVFPARRRIWASSRWGRVTTDRPSTASNRSPGRIWPLLAAGLPRRTVTNRWGRSEAAGEGDRYNLLKGPVAPSLVE